VQSLPGRDTETNVSNEDLGSFGLGDDPDVGGPTGGLARAGQEEGENAEGQRATLNSQDTSLQE
jgi:hypothetical protein